MTFRPTRRSAVALSRWIVVKVSAFATQFNDFFAYAAADWTLTTVEAGAGSATEALQAGPGGQLLVTNDAASRRRRVWVSIFAPTPGRAACTAVKRNAPRSSSNPMINADHLLASRSSSVRQGQLAE